MQKKDAPRKGSPWFSRDLGVDAAEHLFRGQESRNIDSWFDILTRTVNGNGVGVDQRHYIGVSSMRISLAVINRKPCILSRSLGEREGSETARIRVSFSQSWPVLLARSLPLRNYEFAELLVPISDAAYFAYLAKHRPAAPSFARVAISFLIPRSWSGMLGAIKTPSRTRCWRRRKSRRSTTMYRKIRILINPLARLNSQTSETEDDGNGGKKSPANQAYQIPAQLELFRKESCQ